MELVKERFRRSKALLAMLLVQIFATGMQLLSRIILVQGTFIYSLIAYRHIVAALCVAPFAFYFERGSSKKLNWSVWLWLFANALVGIIFAMGFFYYGLRYTSATYAVNFLNMVPIFTFFVSIICRMEKLELKSLTGKAKTVGAILCVGGALTTGLYKGKEFYIGSHSHHTVIVADESKTNMVLGTIFLLGSCLSYTAWYIVQVKVHTEFPYKYWATMLTCVIASVQAVVIGVCIDRSQSAWRLGWNLQLVTILYSGALATAATFCMVSWAVSIKGPTYPPMFNPLALIFVAASEAILLGAPIKVGTLLGMVFIIIGLYCFLWGKRGETQSLPQPNEAVAEVSTYKTDEPVGVQSTAIVVPSHLPDETAIDIEYIDKNTK